LLPLEAPSDLPTFWQPLLPADWHEFGRKYSFPFMPHGFFGRFLVRCYHLLQVTGVAFWRNGLIIKSNVLEQIANITFDPVTFALLIRVRVPVANLSSISGPTALLRQIIDSIETLLDCYYHRVSVTRLVMCSHCAALRSPNAVPFFFTYAECLELVEAGEAYCFCQHIRSPSRCVRIDLLAPDIVFSDLSVIEECDLDMQQAIGQGGFGQIFKGTLKRVDRTHKIRALIRASKQIAPDAIPHEYTEELDDDEAATGRAGEDGKLATIPVAIKELKISEVASRESKFRDFQTEAYIMRYDVALGTRVVVVVFDTDACIMCVQLFGTSESGEITWHHDQTTFPFDNGVGSMW
jgi:hypothetical protein